MTPSIHYPASSTENYNRVQRMLAMEVLVCREYNFFSTKQQFIEATVGIKRFENKPQQGLLYLDDGFISYVSNDKTISCTIYADNYDKVDKYSQMFSSFRQVKANITWVYSQDGSSTMVPITDDKPPQDEFYPFLGKSLDQYYQDFMDSSQNILILIGNPGTGKSNFLRGLLQYTGVGATVSYDPEILGKDHIFAEFIDSDNNFLIMEDCDTLLKPRKDGNTMMAKFLNVGDGLVTVPKKKLIFTTNLPSVSDIDDALTRPGRCYDIINFQPLTTDEANAIRKKFDKAEQSFGGTLAEVLNERKNENRSTKTSFGFM